MAHCNPRDDEYSKKIDAIDAAIAALVKERDDLVETMPRNYDSCGEGEVYYMDSDLDRAEQVYHCMAQID